jgi:hypothetical protein
VTGQEGATSYNRGDAIGACSLDVVHGPACPCSEVLIPDDIVNNNAGFASLEAAATATSIGISYVFHRTGHHKMERWLSIVHMSVTAFGDAHNYALKSKHP